MQKIDRIIHYNGTTAIRSTNEHLGTEEEDYSQTGYDQYHSHPDYQLMCLTEGKVDVLVEGHRELFNAGDVILLGPGLPHVLHAKEGGCHGVLFQFKQELFPKDMADIPEYHSINLLLHRSNEGLIFRNTALKENFLKLHESQWISRLCSLLGLLDQLAGSLQESRTVVCLSSDESSDTSGQMIERCRRFLKVHYRENLSLSDIAQAVGANASALSRMYHRDMGETLFHDLSRLRITYALRLLRDTKLSISEIAYRSGFNNIPNFNRVFKQSQGLTPKDYREMMSGNVHSGE